MEISVDACMLIIEASREEVSADTFLQEIRRTRRSRCQGCRRIYPPLLAEKLQRYPLEPALIAMALEPARHARTCDDLEQAWGK